MPRFTKETARAFAIKGNRVRWAPPVPASPNPDNTAMAARVAETGVLSLESIRARQRLSAELQTQLAILERTPPLKLRDLSNTPDGEGRASLAKRLVDTASTIYGWDADKGATVVMVGMVERVDPDNAQPAHADAKPIIDV